MMNFRITQGKGFYFGFPNGWGVSVQFGPGNYADNYDDSFKSYEKCGEDGSYTAECAVITPNHELFEHPSFENGSVKGYCSPDDVMQLLLWAQSQGTAKSALDTAK